MRNSLLDRYRQLAAVPNHQSRGYDLEALVGDLFGAAHFNVIRDAGAARPRQTDLVATMGSATYLIETTWESSPADVSEVDEVRTRLLETDGHVVGLLVSVAGFTKTAVDRVVERRTRQILLVTGVELEQLLGWPAGLRAFLRRKSTDLVVNGRVRLDEEPTLPERRGDSPLPAGEARIVDLQGGTRNPLRAEGGFDDLVFVDRILDVDWVLGGGHGVVADVPLNPQDANGLVAVLEELSSRGWTSGRGRWAIHQAHVTWHGFGCQEFAEATLSWEERYAPLRSAHHTEQVIYVDAMDAGLYTLSADVLAEPSRRVDHCNLSLQFIGVPLDQSPIRDLAEAFDADGAVYFRPLSERAVVGHRLSHDEAQDLEPLGFVIEDQSDDEVASGGLPMATGVVVRNPFLAAESCPSWWPREATECEMLVCDLRSWHPLGEPRSAYHLWMIESTRTSDAFVFRPVVDWEWTDTPLGRPPWEQD